jgi:hypothetical protein
MNLTEFFESDTVALPRPSGLDDVTFDSFLNGLVQGYIALLQTVDDPQYPGICAEIRAAVPKVRYLAAQIEQSAKFYLDGHPHRAHAELKKALDALEIGNLFTTLSRYLVTGSFHGQLDDVLASSIHPTLYRVRSDRTAASDGELSRKDMFHLPFEKRRMVKNQRYSIAGLPCLYLGSSIWICREELGRSSLDSLSISRFRITDKVVVLDFQYQPDLEWKLFKWVNGPQPDQVVPEQLKDAREHYSEKLIVSHIIFWSLIAACSIKIPDRTGSFHPECIIPPFLLRWVTADITHRVDGIRCFSTRTKNKQSEIFCTYELCVSIAGDHSERPLCSFAEKLSSNDPDYLGTPHID